MQCSPLRTQSSFPQLSCILRVSSPRQLDLTSISEIVNRDLAALFPGGPAPFAHLHHADHLEEALELALQYGVESGVRLVCIGNEVAFCNLPPHRPRRHWFIALPLQPTLTQGGSMIRLAQKVMMHQAKAHPTPYFPREHFTFVIAYSCRLSRTLHPFARQWRGSPQRVQKDQRFPTIGLPQTMPLSRHTGLCTLPPRNHP
jgi:hypothetical protein